MKEEAEALRAQAKEELEKAKKSLRKKIKQGGKSRE